MVSRFTEAKDHATVLRAMKHIATPGVTLAFAGTGATMDSCRRLALELGIQNQVLFLGDRDDAQALMAQASIGVQSSHWEGFGLTAVEFMAAGTPVVASDVEGLRQVVEGAGIVFPQGDYVALARTIDLLFTDSELYSSCVYGGKSRAGEYSIKNTAHAEQTGSHASPKDVFESYVVHYVRLFFPVQPAEETQSPDFLRGVHAGGVYGQVDEYFRTATTSTYSSGKKWCQRSRWNSPKAPA